VRFSAILGGIAALVPGLISLAFVLIFTFGFGSAYYGSNLLSLIWFLVLPLIGILGGGILGLVFGLFYNWLAPIIGGVKMELVFHPQEGEEIKQ